MSDEPLDGMLCFEVYGTHQAFGQTYKTLLDPLGLTYPQYLVLLLLWSKDNQAVGILGKQLGLASNTLTPLLKRMELNGLLIRGRDLKDERRVVISLTAEGQALQAQAAHVPDCVAKACGLSMDEFTVLQTMLVKARTALLSAPTTS